MVVIVRPVVGAVNVNSASANAGKMRLILFASRSRRVNVV